jgi:hypothetical protein
MQPTSNFNVFSQYRLDVKADMSDLLSFNKSYNSQLTTMRDLQRGNVPFIDSKTLIYDQSRIVSPMNYYGTKFIEFKDHTVRHNPAGIFNQNSTRATGSSFTKPFIKSFPQNL